MALDPNISLGVRPIQFQMPNQLAQYGQLQQIMAAQDTQQMNALKMQEAQAALDERNALRRLDPTSADYESQLFKVNPQLGIAFRKEAATTAAQKAAESKSLAGAAGEKQKLLSQALRDISGRPSDANIIAHTEDIQSSPLFSTEEKAQALATQQRLLTIPFAERQAYLAAQGASASELKPTLTQQDFGGGKRVITTPAFGGAATLVPGSDITKTPTFADITSQGQLAVSQGQLKVSQGQLKVAQDRLLKEGAALDPAENAAISKAIIEGRLDPNRVNGRNAKILATTLLANPDANVLELGVSASGATAAERSLATQTAKMSTAANEANKMVDVVRTLSDKVDRTEFPTISAITNAVSKGTGGKEIVQLNASINALVNSYARAISPTGQPTVSDKNHAREVINSAYSTGQISAILDVMQQEMSIAREAAGTASTELKASREKARGRGEEKPATGALSAAEQTELDQLRQRFKK
jgi:hypothetical protein